MLRPHNKRAQVQGRGDATNIQRRRGSHLRRFWQCPSYSPHRLVSHQNAKFQEQSVQSCRTTQLKSCLPLDDHWVILSTSKPFNYFLARRFDIQGSFGPPEFLDKITVEERCGQSEFGQKFPNVFEASDTCNPLPKSLANRTTAKYK